jgi:glutamate dehydrogenase (NAD(P)+)
MEDVIVRLEAQMKRSLANVVKVATEYDCDWRMAAYIQAIKRIELAYTQRGVFP